MDSIADTMDQLNLSEDSDAASDDSAESGGVLLVSTAMYPSDGKAHFRTRNSAKDPFQRTTGTDRKGVINVRCKILDVVHGTMLPTKPDAFATLIVFKCTFFSKKLSRRVRSADIELVFKGRGAAAASGAAAAGESAPDPEVVDIAPQGKYCLMPETEEETVTREASGGASVPLVGGVGAEASLKWQKVRSRQRKKYTTMVGEAGLYGRDEGEDDGAAWTLLENPITNDGVPEAFRGAVLLKRRDNRSHFQCDLRITVKTDRWTAFANLFESAPLDEPILFDPKLPSTDRLRVYETDRLADVRLDDFVDINMMKIKSGVVHEG